jgi:20S proteasome alpha/beta subunit
LSELGPGRKAFIEGLTASYRGKGVMTLEDALNHAEALFLDALERTSGCSKSGCALAAPPADRAPVIYIQFEK